MVDKRTFILHCSLSHQVISIDGINLVVCEYWGHARGWLFYKLWVDIGSEIEQWNINKGRFLSRMNYIHLY